MCVQVQGRLRSGGSYFLRRSFSIGDHMAAVPLDTFVPNGLLKRRHAGPAAERRTYVSALLQKEAEKEGKDEIAKADKIEAALTQRRRCLG